MIEYIWKISYMETKPSEDGLTDVVVSARWDVSAREENYSASNYGMTTFGPPQPQDFTAYDNLTQDQVLNWIWSAPPENSGVNKQEVEDNLAVQIEQQKNPPVVILPNPWANKYEVQPEA